LPERFVVHYLTEGRDDRFGDLILMVNAKSKAPAANRGFVDVLQGPSFPEAVCHRSIGRKPRLGSLPLATLLPATLLSRLVTTIGVLILLAWGVLPALLATMTLIVLATLLTALMLAALILLVLILVHRCLLEFPIRID
jgi:hypothetical protein